MPQSKKRKTSNEDIVTGIYTGLYTPKKLPEDLYYVTGEKLHTGVKDGLGVKFRFDLKSEELAAELKTNVYMFSAAKTFQQTLEMSDALVDGDGNRRSFKDFKEEANKIYEKYNGSDVEDDTPSGWLKTEYDSAIASGRMADKWDEIEKNKADSPNLMYQTTEDDRVCEICEPLDTIILPVDDPFWDDNYPPNHFGCYCTVVQMDDETTQEQGGVDKWSDIEKDVKGSMDNKQPMWNHNVGKSREVFKTEGTDKHPYFIVPKEYKEFARNNFDLKIPND